MPSYRRSLDNRAPRPRFEFDDTRSHANAIKHGIDFELAQRLWRSCTRKAKTFDKKFDAGHDLTADLDLTTARRGNTGQRRVNVDFPTWMIDALDREAERLGVTRQSIIKVWIAERLEQRER